MKYLTTASLILTILANAPAFAGGPVITEDAYTAEAPATKRDRVPLWVFLALGVVVAAAISGNGDDVCNTEEPVEPEQPSGCR